MANKVIYITWQIRRDTTENWLKNKDVILAAGEPALDLDTGVVKFGDGKTTYENLPAGGTLAGDGLSIQTQDGVVRLSGFDAAESGMYPRKAADGTLEWVAAAPGEVPAATAEQLGLVKSSKAENGVSVKEDGTMEVNSLNIQKLVQTEGDVIVFDGGNAGGGAEGDPDDDTKE